MSQTTDRRRTAYNVVSTTFIIENLRTNVGEGYQELDTLLIDVREYGRDVNRQWVAEGNCFQSAPSVVELSPVLMRRVEALRDSFGQRFTEAEEKWEDEYKRGLLTTYEQLSSRRPWGSSNQSDGQETSQGSAGDAESETKH